MDVVDDNAEICINVRWEEPAYYEWYDGEYRTGSEGSRAFNEVGLVLDAMNINISILTQNVTLSLFTHSMLVINHYSARVRSISRG